MNSYEKTADALTERILALGPQILDLNDPWKLFKVPGFKCDDIGPSLAQASWALRAAQERLRAALLDAPPPEQEKR